MATAVIGGGKGVNTVQTGTITIGAAETTHDDTITSVDTTKSAVLRGGFEFSVAGGDTDNVNCRVYLLNATTVRAERDTTGGEIVVQYVVIEYE